MRVAPMDSIREEHQKGTENQLGRKHFAVSLPTMEKNGTDNVQQANEGITNTKIEIVYLEFRNLVGTWKSDVKNGQHEQTRGEDE
jgi:hypothetical protein